MIVEDDYGQEGFDAIVKTMVPNISIDDYEIIMDREEAVASTIEKHDFNRSLVIALLAKGDEKYMKRGLNFEPYISDVEIAKNQINRYNNNLESCKN